MGAHALSSLFDRAREDLLSPSLASVRLRNDCDHLIESLQRASRLGPQSPESRKKRFATVTCSRLLFLLFLLPELLPVNLPLETAHPIQDEDTVEMIHFMLQGNGQNPLGFQLNLLAFG